MRSHPTPGELGTATIVACRAGDRAALESVFRAEAPALAVLIKRLVRNDADAEDILQATLIAAIEAFGRFRGDASVRTWMSRIAVHTVQRHWRYGAVRRHTPLELVAEGDKIDGAPRPDQVAESRRQLAKIYDHLDRVGARKRIAFILHVIDGRPVDEVAALTGASRAATRSRIFWARRALMSRARKDPALAALFQAREGER